MRSAHTSVDHRHKETCLLQQPYLLDDTHSVHVRISVDLAPKACSPLTPHAGVAEIR